MRASRLEIVLTVTVWTSVLSDKDFLEHAVSSDGGVESPPKYTRPWGGWTPPEAGALRAFEVGFSEAISRKKVAGARRPGTSFAAAAAAAIIYFFAVKRLRRRDAPHTHTLCL